MKKILLATTVLVGFASAASADITFSGYGRFGVAYYSNPGVGAAKAVIDERMRINIDGKTVTDGGVTFGGRLRLESNANNTQAGIPNAAMLYATANGMRMEVGNVNEALDSVALFYNSEMGFEDSSFGEAYNFDSYRSSQYSLADANRMGVFFSYSAGPLNARISVINHDQTLAKQPVGADKEYSISADYTVGQFTVAAGAAKNSQGVKDQFYNFVGAAYAVSPDINVGLNYNNGTNLGLTGSTLAPTKAASITTLYGNYTMGAITLKGYIANTNDNTVKNQTIAGVGADYALGGGARLSGSIRPDWAGETAADIGVRFDF